jgi:hypothetical protein
MFAVNVRRSTRLTPRPTLGPLYLLGAVTSGALLVATVVDRRADVPLLLALVLLFASSYLYFQQGIYLVDESLVLQHPVQRTVIPLAQVKAFTIRPDSSRPDRKVLTIELLNGQLVRSQVGVTRSLFSPAIRVTFEQMVALVETLDAHRRRVTSDPAPAA